MLTTKYFHDPRFNGVLFAEGIDDSRRHIASVYYALDKNVIDLGESVRVYLASRYILSSS